MAAIIYFVVCLIVAPFGRDRIIGFWGTFILAILVTPIIAAFILLIGAPRLRNASQRSESASG